MGYFLVYVSAATHLFSRDELDEILTQSYANNARLGISGALLYKGGNVMQVLEGEKSAVETLYAKIARDPRHTGLITVLAGEQSDRQFADWSMAFRDLNEGQARATPGYSEFLNTRLTSDEFASNPTLARKLLSSFKSTM